jgi:ornithine cyclodeaminase/alanine dehydrogenase-like protein (mu-crystallin family)
MEAAPIILNEEEVRKRLRMEDLIPAMADALRDLSAGAVLQPLRTVLSISPHNGFLGVMPASGRALGASW